MLEAIPLRLYFQCGWVITVSRDFDGEMLDGGETLRMFDKEREISLSSINIRRHDGTPMPAAQILSLFPPLELTGAHHTRDEGGLQGRGVWMEAANDAGPPSYVLMAILVAGDTGKAARVTIVSPKREDHLWAVETWKAVRLGELPEGMVMGQA